MGIRCSGKEARADNWYIRSEDSWHPSPEHQGQDGSVVKDKPTCKHRSKCTNILGSRWVTGRRRRNSVLPFAPLNNKRCDAKKRGDLSHCSNPLASWHSGMSNLQDSQAPKPLSIRTTGGGQPSSKVCIMPCLPPHGRANHIAKGNTNASTMRKPGAGKQDHKSDGQILISRGTKK